MYVWRNIVTRSHNVYSSKAATLTAWYHFNGRERFYGNLMSWATKQRTGVIMESARHFVPDFNQNWIFL